MTDISKVIVPQTAGGAQALDGIEKVAGMGLMGLGGLVAVVGGVLFLVITFKAMWPEKRTPDTIVQERRPRRDVF